MREWEGGDVEGEASGRQGVNAREGGCQAAGERERKGGRGDARGSGREGNMFISRPGRLMGGGMTLFTWV